MYQFAVLIGLYSYSIFFIGVAGLLNRGLVALLTAVFSTLVIILIFRLIKFPPISGIKKGITQLKFFEKIILLLLLSQIIVNLIGVLGPELAFDSLWYHLTLPKIYIENHKIFHIPGGLLYYSDMPKLIEVLYVPILMFGNEIAAKFIEFLFGLGCLLVLYELSRKFISKTSALIVLLIFYSNLVVDWLSITSYVDLGRTFFELIALCYLLVYIKEKKIRNLIFSAVALGFAISTKIFSGLDILIFAASIAIFTRSLKNSVVFIFISLLIPLPWFIFAFVNSGHPFYPFFSSIYPISLSANLSNILNFIHSPDPISPIYLICFPIILILFRKFHKYERLIAFYSSLCFIVWFFAPQSGGGRFILAYLPAFSLLVILSVDKLKNGFLKSYILFLILFVAITSIGYRGIANIKYIPVIFGTESKFKFLTKNLNFSFGDFYDVDNYFETHIKGSDRVLIYGIHNLYYVNFPYIHESWYKKGDYFDYVLVRGDIPQKFKDVNPVYENSTTNVKLYKAK